MRAAAVVLVLCLAATRLAAQQPEQRACGVMVDTTGGGVVAQMGPSGQYQIFAGGYVRAHCEADPATRMEADSFAWYPERNELHLVGNVHFRDSTSLLDADFVTYWVRQERLLAQGHVYTQKLRTRSDLRGPNLDYRRAKPGVRDTVEIYATGRPTVRFFTAREGARGDSTEPFVIVSDRARMKGNDVMWGGGRVTVDRSDLAARGDSAMLDLAADRGLLLGAPPSVEGKGERRYRLTGTRIDFRLDEGHNISRVLASGRADAQGPDWTLRSDTLDLTLDSGLVQGALAWGRDRRPDAVSGTYTIVADSLDIRMPAQVVREVWAFGRGRATTRPDSTVTEDDWMTGDTLHAEFAPRVDSARAGAAGADSAVTRPAAADSASRSPQELRRLMSFGAARSLYHVVDEQHRDEQPGVNYVRGRRITIAMLAGKVSTVDVVRDSASPVEGVYLEPIRGAARSADSAAGAAPDSQAVARTARADTAGARRPPTDSTRTSGDSGAARVPTPADTARIARPDPADTARVRRVPTAPRPRSPRPRPAEQRP